MDATDGRVSAETLIARARAMVPVLRERQERTESDRRISDEIFGEMIDADLYRLLLPARFGGFEHGLDTYVDVVFEIARGCGSTGWVYSVTAKYHLFLGMFEKEAQDDVWGSDPNAVIVVSIVPNGTAVPVDGGYSLSGNWMYCSGIDNSAWTIVATTVPDADGGEGVRGYALAPTADFGIEDNWSVVGLAGTGSKTAYSDGLFVPAHRFLSLADSMTGNPPGAAVNPGPMFRIPLFSMISISLCAPILGMAQGAYEEFVDATRARVTRGAALSEPVPMASLPNIHMKIGDAAASIDAARLLVDRDCKTLMRTVSAGDELTVEARARNKRNLAFAARLSTRAADLMFEAGGGGGLFTSARIQRYWRDIHAASMHISMNFDAVSALYGRIALGLPPGPAQF